MNIRHSHIASLSPICKISMLLTGDHAVRQTHIEFFNQKLSWTEYGGFSRFSIPGLFMKKNRIQKQKMSILSKSVSTSQNLPYYRNSLQKGPHRHIESNTARYQQLCELCHWTTGILLEYEVELGCSLHFLDWKAFWSLWTMSRIG